MNMRIQAALVSLFALSLALGACSRDDVAKQRMATQTPTSPSASESSPPSSAPPSTPSPDSSASSSSPTPDTSTQNTSAGNASSQDTSSAETAKASDTPMSTMDKEEESKSMPKPGQVNDHSTVAQDPKAPK